MPKSISNRRKIERAAKISLFVSPARPLLFSALVTRFLFVFPLRSPRASVAHLFYRTLRPIEVSAWAYHSGAETGLLLA
jgi:hypothetical protein